MDSIDPKCQTLKEDYDKCFNQWFKKYLMGIKGNECRALAQKYQACVRGAIAEQMIDIHAADEFVLGTDKEMKPPTGHAKSSK